MIELEPRPRFSHPVTEGQLQAFLRLLEDLPVISDAARAAGLSPATVWRRSKQDPEFRRQMDEAIQIGISNIEDEAIKRAIQGIEEPVFYQGEIVGHVTRKSDTLLMFVLKKRKPEVYGDRSEVNMNVSVQNLSEEERVQRVERLLKLAEQRRQESQLTIDQTGQEIQVPEPEFADV